MTTAQIIAAETFGSDNEYRLDVLSSRFGDYEFFVVLGGEVIAQSDDMKVTNGLRDVVGISEAVEKVAHAVAQQTKTCPMCSGNMALSAECPVCHGKGAVTIGDLLSYWTSRHWNKDEMRHRCITCKKEYGGGVPWAPLSHGICSDECTPEYLKGGP